MGFLKNFACGTLFSSCGLITYWYYYPRHFYENYKFINKITTSNIKKSHTRPEPPTHH